MEQAERRAEVEGYVVYALTDPRDGATRYIGRTSGPLETRLRGHLSQRHHSYTGGSKAKRAWLDELVSLGLEPSIRALESLSSELDAVDAEGRWIAKGIAEGWRLTNRQKSGRGMLSAHGNRERVQRYLKERPFRDRDSAWGDSSIETRFLPRRLRFGSPEDLQAKRGGGTFGSVLVIWRPR